MKPWILTLIFAVFAIGSAKLFAGWLESQAEVRHYYDQRRAKLIEAECILQYPNSVQSQQKCIEAWGR